MAREERGALDAMVTTVRVHSAKLTETGKSLEQVTAKAAAAMGSLDAVAKRIEELERRARGLVDVEKRAQVLDQNINLAQSRLAEDYDSIRKTSREAREDAALATAAVKDVENKMGRLSQLQDLSQATEGKLAALNALAEHITQKTKVLGGGRSISSTGLPSRPIGSTNWSGTWVSRSTSSTKASNTPRKVKRRPSGWKHSRRT